jgi:hypothetical protein
MYSGKLLPGWFREFESLPGWVLLFDAAAEQSAVPGRVELPAGLHKGQSVLLRELLPSDVGERESVPVGLLLSGSNAAAAV